MKFRLCLLLLLAAISAFGTMYGDEKDRRTTPPLPPYLTPSPSESPTASATPTPIAPSIRYGYLEGKIYDSALKRMTAARIEIRGSSGELVGGHTDGMPLWAKGHFRIRLPEGMYKFVATRGRFHLPHKTPPLFTIEPNKTTTLDIPMTSWGPSRKANWYSFDPLVFTACGKALSDVPSLSKLALLCEAEGLDFVNAAPPWWFDPPPNITATNDPTAIASLSLASSSDMFKMAVTPFYDKRPYFGWFYGIGRNAPVEYELPDDPYVPNALVLAKITASGSIPVVYNPSRHAAVRTSTSRWARLNNSMREFGEIFSLLEGYASELPYDIMSGSVSVIDAQNQQDLAVWFAALNKGYRVTAISSSSARVGETRSSAPVISNYAFIKGEASIPQLAAAVAQGKILVAKGPFIEFTVNDSPPGSVLSADSRDAFAKLRITAPAGDYKVASVKVIRNGIAIQSSESADNPFAIGETVVERSFRIRENGYAWYIVMATDNTGGVSYTNPIYFIEPDKDFTRKSPLPRTISVSVVGVDGKRIDADLRVITSERTIASASFISTAEGDTTIQLTDTPPDAMLIVTSSGYKTERVNLFGEFVFKPAIRNWCLARDNNPSLSNSSIYDELYALCGKGKIEIRLMRE